MHQSMRRALTARVVRSHHPASEPGYTTAENHPAEPLLDHFRKAQLREEIRGPAIRAPGKLEIFNGDFVEGLDAGFQGEASVVEEDGRVAHCCDDFGVQAPGVGVGGEVGLEGIGADA